ncbi:MAG: acyltransferase [Burkholderiaceae bacterium]|nr:acyltransferase [Burkholderiaceae bacterium]
MTHVNEKRDVSRNFGLDVCRTAAILLVVSGHTLQHSNPHPILAKLGMCGLFGVDLFFCLSGFLIGRILLAEAKHWPVGHEAGLFGFWYRRWMRTLPLYFVNFIVSLRYDWRGATRLVDQLPYLLFCQNLAWKMPDFFRLSWSLAVEEWFYLTFPLVLLVFCALGKSARRAALLAIAVFISVPFLFRIFLPAHLTDMPIFDEGLRNIVVFRLDSIGFGVLIAYLYMWKKDWFATLAKCWPLFAILVAACIAYTKSGYVGLADSPALAPFYFLISSFAFAMLIPKFNSLKPTRFSLLNSFVTYTSKISYSLYLGHIFGFMIAMDCLRKFGLFDAVYPNPWITYPLFWATGYVLASATYLTIERPILKLRDKRSHGAFHPVEADAGAP